YKLAKELYGHREAIFSVVALHASPYFFYWNGASVLPDNSFMAAWALLYMLKLRKKTLSKAKGFSILGVFFGMALLAKYHALFIPAGFLVATLYDQEFRRWRRGPWLYVSLAIGRKLAKIL
ncbi:MAG: glycosyltransferase family 39 protein, partial [Pseudomonadota bacterium]